MHGIYTNGHHLSLISGRRSENAALNPITSPWPSPTGVRRREEDREREREEDKEIKSTVQSEEGVAVWGFRADWTDGTVQ